MCVHLSQKTEVCLKYEGRDGFGKGFAGLDQVAFQGVKVAICMCPDARTCEARSAKCSRTPFRTQAEKVKNRFM